MYFHFESITVKGFFSIAEASLELANQGLVLVSGKNNFDPHLDSNGAGKSSVFEAIIWCLTGRTSRGAKDVTNPRWQGYTEVSLSLLVDGVAYTVTRCVKHPKHGNNLFIIRDGEDRSGKNLTMSKELLQKELDLDYETLTAVMILSQGMPSKITAYKPSARKSRLNELSNLDVMYEEVRGKVEQEHQRLSSELSKLESEVSSLEGKKATYEDIVSDRQERLQQLDEISMDAQKVQSLEEYMNEEAEYLQSVNSAIEELTQLHSKATLDFNTIESRLNEIHKEVQRLLRERGSFSKESVCPTCKKSNCPNCGEILIGDTDLKSILEGYDQQVSALKQEATEKLESMESVNEEIKRLEQERHDKIQDYNSRLEGYNKAKEQVDAYKNASSQRSSYEADIEQYTQEVDSLNKQLSDLRSREKELRDRFEICDFLKKEVSRDFKTYLLQGVVDYLNEKAAMYSQMLFGAGWEVSLVLQGNDIIIMLGDRVFENLSGGEGRRADIVLQLAQRDLAKNEIGLSSNIVVADEIFDGLDQLGVGRVVELFTEKSAEVSSVFIVSNKYHALPCDYTLLAEKGSDEITRIVDMAT